MFSDLCNSRDTTESRIHSIPQKFSVAEQAVAIHVHHKLRKVWPQQFEMDGEEVEMRCMVRVESKLNGETDRQKHRGERQRIE